MSQKVCLQEAREFLAQYVDGGVSPTDPRVDRRINECEELLMQKGSWQGTQKIVRMCTQSGCLTLPRNIKKVVKARINNESVNVMSHWYQFLSGGLGDMQKDMSGWTGLWDALESPTRFDLPEPAKILVYSDTAESADLRMLIRGLDDTGREIFDDGHPGECVLINNVAGIYTKNKFSVITAIEKPDTVGYVFIHAIDITDGDMVFLSQFHPDENKPSYRRYTMKQRQSGTEIDDFGRTRGTYYYNEVFALVKFQHVRLCHPSDTLFIESLPAMKAMIQAQRFYDTNEIQQGQVYEARAEKLLLEQLADFVQAEATIDFVDPIGTTSIEDVR